MALPRTTTATGSARNARAATSRRRRGGHLDRTFTASRIPVLLQLLLALLAVAMALSLILSVVSAHPGSNDGGSPRADEDLSKTGTTQTVGNVKVEVRWAAKLRDRCSAQDVYNAKHGAKDVIYMENRSPFQKTEVDATKAAGQLVAAQGNKMVQHKVGSTGLKEWLDDKKNSPKAKSKYLLVGEKPEDHPGKAKLSDRINADVKKKQQDIGYVHGDIHAGNIRVHTGKGKAQKFEPIDWGTAQKVTDKTKAERGMDNSVIIRGICNYRGFQFRASGSLYRRAPAGACASNAPKAASSANKAAAPGSRSGAGGAVGRSNGGNAASGRSGKSSTPSSKPAASRGAEKKGSGAKK
ncbi:hypothetical protein DFJ73DRAFT_960077 [Zopfochytrium polystomum]|nr:hypothetical protein DFJ73DRAFT_960077 [Zopfochytrium polystomum]